MSSKPFVSVITPTYNRRRFLKTAIDVMAQQEYPMDRMEWIILDDGTDKVEDLFLPEKLPKKFPKVRYEFSPEKLLIGQKRNRLNDMATGDIIVAWDDDDYYSPDRISHVVQKFQANPRIELAGSSKIYMYYYDIKTIYEVGPYAPNHATNGTMAWRKSYSNRSRYDETVTHAEEKSFLQDYRNPMIQLDPLKVMLVMSHRDNTFDKIKLRDNNSLFKKTSLKLKNFIKDNKLREFYAEG